MKVNQDSNLNSQKTLTKKGSKGRKKSKKRSVKQCKCGKTKDVDWTGDGVQYPIFSCVDCGPDARNEWELWWNQYKDRWREKENWLKPAERLSCIVGYFCNKYLEFYGEPYTFSYANPNPYKDKDFVMARRLLAMFNGDANEVRTYIRWVFTKIVKTPKYPVTSFGFFTSPEFVNRYKIAKSRSQIIRRSTKLPKEFLMWCWMNHSDIFELQELENWNDLNGLVSHIKSYGMDTIEGKIVEEAVRRGMLPPGPGYRKLEE